MNALARSRSLRRRGGVALALLGVGTGLFSVVACGGPQSKMPSYYHQPAHAKNVAADDIGRTIARACARRGWQFQKNGRRQAVASYNKGRLMAAVDIAWTASEYTMTYSDSRGFRYNHVRNSIHPRFVHWFKRLRYTINVELQRLAGAR